MSAQELISQWNEALAQALTQQPETPTQDLTQAETQAALRVRTDLRAGQSTYWQGIRVC